jgi:GxxExxY protein
VEELEMGKKSLSLRYADLSGQIIASAIAVHRELGPGLLESAYQRCLEFEFDARDIVYEREKPLPIVYRGNRLDCGYRLDFVVENKIIVELKSISSINAIHKAQLLSYLRIANLKLGLLMNFNVELLKRGVRRIAN